MHVGIVGGGAVGLVVAGDLARSDVEVTLYERDTLGSGASGRAAGICYDAFADPTDAAVAVRAIARYREWDLYSPRPYVWVARETADATAVREQVAAMRALGLDVEELSPATLGERYPAIETAGLTACAVANDAGTVAPEAVVTSLAERERPERSSERGRRRRWSTRRPSRWLATGRPAARSSSTPSSLLPGRRPDRSWPTSVSRWHSKRTGRRYSSPNR
jgi:sarcosine oxidase subunit beta